MGGGGRKRKRDLEICTYVRAEGVEWLGVAMGMVLSICRFYDS